MKNKARPTLSQKERKHKSVKDAARKMFLKQGFAATSMDDIASLAGVSKKTVYDHFGSKESLFQTVLTEHWNLVFGIGKPFADTSKSAAVYLTQFAHAFLMFLYQQETIDLFRLLISESWRFPYLAETLLVKGKAPFTRELIEFLTIKKKNNELRIKSPERAASYFMGLLKEYHFWPMMLGFTQQKKLSKPKQFAKEVVELFIKSHECIG